MVNITYIMKHTLFLRKIVQTIKNIISKEFEIVDLDPNILIAPLHNYLDKVLTHF